jgi:hypothetical protein
MIRTSKSLLGVVLGGALLFGGPWAGSVRAQDAKHGEVGSHPDGAEVAFEWQYSCPNARGCSFNCSGSGGASGVTKLALRLMSIPLGTKKVAGIFYEFSTLEIPRANGFNITTGLSTVACQVNGMTLDHSGAPKQNEPLAVPKKQSESSAVTSSLSRQRERDD